MRIPTMMASVTIVAVALAAGCEKKPPKEAKAVLAKALDAIKAKDTEKFKALVVPDQRDKIVFDKTMVLSGQNIKELPLSTLMSIPFFSTFTDYSIEKGYVDSKTESYYLVTFNFPKGFVGSTFLSLSKTKEGWRLNMKKSVLREKRSNGAHMYTAMKFTKK